MGKDKMFEFEDIDKFNNDASDTHNNEESTDESQMVETVYLPEETYTPSKDYSRVGFGVAAFYALWNILVMIMGVLYFAISEQETISVPYAVTLSVLGEVMGIPVLLFIIRGISFEPLKKNKINVGMFFKALCAGFFLGISGNIISSVINSIVSSGGGVASVSKIDDYLDKNFNVLLVVYIAIVGPVIEELLFRKVLIDKLYRYGKPLAMITSGLIFGLVHGNIEQFFYTFFIGCFLAFVYLKTGNIKMCIALHCVVNSFSLMITYLFIKLPILSNIGDPTELVDAITKDKNLMTMTLFLAAFVIAEYIMAFIGLIVFVTHFKSFTFNEENPRRASVAKCWITPGMLLCFLLTGGMMILGLFGISI